jgi:hypothetical protein
MRYEVFAGFPGAVKRVQLAHLDVGCSSSAVLGLGAIDRREVAVISAGHLTRVVAPLGRRVDALGLCALPSAPPRRRLLVR